MQSERLSGEQIQRLLFLLSDGWIDEADEDDYSRSWETFRHELLQIDSPIALHCLAANLNWDYGTTGIRMALDHPLCDAGTALMLYWLGEPGHIARQEPEVVALLNLIQERYLAGSFGPARISIDPHDIFGENKVQVGDVSAIPSMLLTPTPGFDATGVANIVRMLTAIEWFRKGSLQARDLAASIDNPKAIAGVEQKDADRIRALGRRLRRAAGSADADVATVDELERLLYALAGAS